MVTFWRQRGIRIGALVWNHPNAFATPAAVDAETHMTPEGIRIARVMQRQGISVDVSHLNEAGFWDLFAKGERPPMASHSCCRALCDHVRNLTDDQIRAMIQYGGYIGVNFYPRFLSADCKADSVTIGPAHRPYLPAWRLGYWLGFRQAISTASRCRPTTCGIRRSCRIC